MLIDSNNQQPSVNVYPNGGYNNGGMGGDMGGGWFFWMFILFFFAMFGGWGNGYAGGNGGQIPYMMGNLNTQSEVRQGFDQAALVGGINGLQNAMTNGFSNAEVSRCNQQANLLATMNNNQNSSIAAMNAIQGQLAQCCCDNRAATADLKYTVATEACNDRAAVNDALQAVTAQNNANMNAMMMAFNNGVQSLKDDFCQFQMNAKDAQIADLQRQLTAAQMSDLVNGSRNAIIANNDLQTAALEQYLDPTPRPAYIVQNPNGCGYNSCNGCRG